MSEAESVCALIMAAGKGTRMEAAQPKVLHTLEEKPLLRHVLDNVRNAGITEIYVVVGHKAGDVKDVFADIPIKWVTQEKQLGTGHAVMCARPLLEDYPGNMLVINGDSPLIPPETIRSIISRHRETDAAATILTCYLKNPTGFGRIIHNGHPDGRPMRIVEEKDTSDKEHKITEVNGGLYCFRARDIFPLLEGLRNDNAKHEYYLTEVVQLANDKGLKVAAYSGADPREIFNVNTPEHLREAESLLKEG